MATVKTHLFTIPDGEEIAFVHRHTPFVWLVLTSNST
jgi:hypothetical protein